MNDEQKALAAEDVKRIYADAPKTEEIVKYELQLGVDPRYVAMKFGMDVERCQRYASRIRPKTSESTGE